MMIRIRSEGKAHDLVCFISERRRVCQHSEKPNTGQQMTHKRGFRFMAKQKKNNHSDIQPVAREAIAAVGNKEDFVELLRRGLECSFP
jgi:hypothetical protein